MLVYAACAYVLMKTSLAHIAYSKRANSNLSLRDTYLPFYAGLKSHLSPLFSGWNKKEREDSWQFFATQSSKKPNESEFKYTVPVFHYVRRSRMKALRQSSSTFIPTLSGLIELPNTAHVVSKTTLATATCVKGMILNWSGSTVLFKLKSNDCLDLNSPLEWSRSWAAIPYFFFTSKRTVEAFSKIDQLPVPSIDRY